MNRSNADALWRVASGLAREAAKVSRADGAPRPNLPPLLFFTDGDRTPGPWRVAARLPVGAGVVFRHFGAPDARETALRLREATLHRDGLLLIGRDADLAEAVEADGVHLPEALISEAAALAVRHPGWTLTAAFHGHSPLPDLTGLDALVVSPASGEKAPLGLEGLTELARTIPRPVYALGGVNASNAPQLSGSGAYGIAGVGSIREAFGA
jgi:thiamine-phosphate pyrophosphorylase